MLSIGKLAAGPGAARYYTDQVARGREDYYGGEGEAAGRWTGTGAASLGLGGEVSEGGLERLLGGADPGSGVDLRRPLASGGVAGFDLTLRAPKSVSVLFAIADPDVVAALREAHVAAVDETVGYLERGACFGRRGAGGATQVRGRGCVAAALPLPGRAARPDHRAPRTRLATGCQRDCRSGRCPARGDRALLSAARGDPRAHGPARRAFGARGAGRDAPDVPRQEP